MKNLKISLVKGFIATAAVVASCLFVLPATAADHTLKADTSKMAKKKMDKMGKMDHKTDDKMSKMQKGKMKKMKDTTSKM